MKRKFLILLKIEIKILNSSEMGKNLHPSIMPFIISKIKGHNSVEHIEDISTTEHIIYKIVRKALCDVNILISDAYYFGDFDYLSKPNELNDGGIILIAKPEAHFYSDSQTNYLADKIIIGKIRVVLGALRIDEFWTYEKPQPVKK